MNKLIGTANHFYIFYYLNIDIAQFNVVNLLKILTCTTFCINNNSLMKDFFLSTIALCDVLEIDLYKLFHVSFQ